MTGMNFRTEAEMSAGFTMRECGRCGVKDIPRMVDWPWWEEGRPVHPDCNRDVTMTVDVRLDVPDPPFLPPA